MFRPPAPTRFLPPVLCVKVTPVGGVRGGGFVQLVNKPPLSTRMLSKMYVHEGAPVGHVRFTIAPFLTLNGPCELADGLRLQIAPLGQSVPGPPLGKD